MNDASKSGKSRGPSKLRWVLGWVVLPGSLVATLFLAGVHLGARHPDMLWSRVVLRAFKAEAGVAAPIEARKPEPRPGAAPGEPFEYHVQLTAAELHALAGRDPACELACRAYAQAKHGVALYSLDRCTLARPLNLGLLVCSGKLEAAPAPAPSN